MFGYTVLPNPFFGGILFPGHRLHDALRVARARAAHHQGPGAPRPAGPATRQPVADRNGAAFFSWIATIFVAGAADRILVSASISYTSQVWFFRFAAFLEPVVVFFITRHVCRELKDSDSHPLRGWSGSIAQRTDTGGFEAAPTRRATERAGARRRLMLTCGGRGSHARPSARLRGVASGVRLPQGQPVAGPGQLGPQRAFSELRQAVEEHLLDTDVVMEVLEVRQSVDRTRRMNVDRRSAMAGERNAACTAQSPPTRSSSVIPAHRVTSAWSTSTAPASSIRSK